MHPRRTLLVTLLGGALTLGGLTGQGVAPAFALAAPTPPPPRIAQSSGPAPAPTGDLAALLDGVPRGVQVALQVLDLETGRPLVSAQGDTPMIPASTMTLLTGAAVLAERGGAGGWWSTELTAPAGELGRAELSHLTLLSGTWFLPVNTFHQIQIRQFFVVPGAGDASCVAGVLGIPSEDDGCVFGV